jgi:uncharacterized DUF497 family protein
MRIEFDPTKDASNQLKHGVSLAMAAELDWDAAWVWVDERVDYNEMRMIALAPKTASFTTWHLWIVVTCEESSVFVEPTDVR